LALGGMTCFVMLICMRLTSPQQSGYGPDRRDAVGRYSAVSEISAETEPFCRRANLYRSELLEKERKLAAKLSQQQQINANWIEAMGHEIRRESWRVLSDQGVCSPKEIADALGGRYPLDKVAHHVRRLAALGCVELVDERKVRGAVAHYYRHVDRVLVEDDQWNQLLEENPMLAKHLLGKFMQAQLDDYARSIRAGTLGNDDRFHVQRTPAVLDAEGLDEALSLAERMEEEFNAIVARSADRRTDTEVEPLRVSWCQSVFATP